MEKGIHLYSHGTYREAKNCFDKAIFIDTEDFESNFWLLRTLTMLNEYDAAESLAARCAKLEPRVATQLVVPWQEVIKTRNQDLNVETFDKLNSETDRLLEYFQQDRNFTITDLVFYLIGAFVFIFALASATRNIAKDVSAYVFICFYFFIILLYYRKPILIPNLWIVGKSVKQNLLELVRNTDFVKVFILYSLAHIAIAILQLLDGGKILINSTLISQNLFTEVVLVLIIGPVAEEILFRGMLFKTVKKYANVWAYPIVSTLFYYYHMSGATIEHFLMSMVFCWAYARYETLWAPILLHMLQNIPHVVAVIWEHVSNII